MTAPWRKRKQERRESTPAMEAYTDALDKMAESRRQLELEAQRVNEAVSRIKQRKSLVDPAELESGEVALDARDLPGEANQ